jgi:segregation and condensation protein A
LSAAYTLRLDVFDGPLDLLLALIERRELDITAISLADVAEEYLTYVRSLPALDADLLSEFIAIGAKLLLIKSTALLPAREQRLVEDASEDPYDLAERLREYQAIKRAANSLREREESGLRSYLRLAPLAPPARVLHNGTGEPEDLLRALERIAMAALRDAPVETVQRELFTIGEKLTLLRRRCLGGARVGFAALLRGGTRGEIVATFLAVLELLRLGEVEIEQGERFGEIAVVGAMERAQARQR